MTSTEKVHRNDAARLNATKRFRPVAWSLRGSSSAIVAVMPGEVLETHGNAGSMGLVSLGKSGEILQNPSVFTFEMVIWCCLRVHSISRHEPKTQRFSKNRALHGSSIRSTWNQPAHCLREAALGSSDQHLYICVSVCNVCTSPMRNYLHIVCK